jgi:hypothetical protein
MFPALESHRKALTGGWLLVRLSRVPQHAARKLLIATIRLLGFSRNVEPVAIAERVSIDKLVP